MNDKAIISALGELTKAVKELTASNQRVERILADIDQGLANLPRQVTTGAPLVKIT